MGKQQPVVNTKVAAAKEKKAQHQAQVDARKQAEAEAQESAEWNAGSKGKSKKEIEEEKKAQLKARKAENEKLLEQEEKEVIGAVKPPPKKSKGPKLDPDNPLMMAAKKATPALRGSEKAAAKKTQHFDNMSKDIERFGNENQRASTEELVASNIDDALDIFDLAAGGSGTASAGVAAGLKGALDRHPERRAKAAYAAFEERMLPQMRKENPSLRLTQVKELLWKQWQKSSENPFNQQHIAHDATKEEEKQFIENLRKQTEDRLRLK